MPDDKGSLLARRLPHKHIARRYGINDERRTLAHVYGDGKLMGKAMGLGQ